MASGTGPTSVPCRSAFTDAGPTTMRTPPRATLRRLPALAALAAGVGLGACGVPDIDAEVPNLRMLGGNYVVRRIDGDSLPRFVTTPAVSGTVIGGAVAIDPNSLEYRGSLEVRTAAGRVDRLTLRGNVGQHGPRSYDSVYFETVNYERQSVAGVQASNEGMRIEVVSLYGMRVELFRRGPARTPPAGG